MMKKRGNITTNKCIKLKYIQVLLLILSIFPALITKAEHMHEKLTIDDFQIGEIRLGQPISEVLNILGEPCEEKLIPHPSNSEWDYVELRYDGIVVGYFKYFEQVVDMIVVTAPEIKTPRGIQVGDEEDEVIATYGETRKFENTRIVYQLRVPGEIFDDIYSICFFVEDGYVTKIRINFAAD